VNSEELKSIIYMKIGIGDQGSVFGDGCFSQHVRRDEGFLSLSFHRDLLIHPLGVA